MFRAGYDGAMPDLTLQVYGIELRTLADVGAARQLYLYCDRCMRLRALDIAALTRRLGGDAALWEVRQKARCSNCHGRQVRLLFHHPTVRGRRAWEPFYPDWARRD